MNSIIKSTIIFAIGAAIGSVVTWKLIKDKYEQISLDEIAEMKEYYSNKYGSPTDDNKEKTVKTFKTENHKEVSAPENSASTEPDIMEYAKKLSGQGYINYTECSDDDEDDDNVVEPVPDDHIKSDKPYAITPDDFGEVEEYDMISLYHYTDGVLADDDDDRITNIDEIVGNDYASHIGEYDDDAAYFRNDRLKCDFEVLRSAKSYAEDVIGSHPF